MTNVLTPEPGTARPSTPLATEKEAREVAEAAREQHWEQPSFVRELFEGNLRMELIHPFPEPDPADVERVAAVFPGVVARARKLSGALGRA